MEGQSLLLRAIRSQTGDVPADLVFVIDILSVRFGGHFTPSIRTELEKYRNLQMLTLNDCAIESLENFPALPNLIRLDLVFNSIKGEDLVHLRASRHIQTLMLGANLIENVQQLRNLGFLKHLMQLDLINNPVYRTSGYREQVFTLFPSLVILDTKDRSGQDAFNNVTMMETVNRIPQHLFTLVDHRAPPAHVHHLTRALSRRGSLDQQPVSRKRVALGARRTKVGGKTGVSERAGLTFPVSRVRRMMKAVDPSGLRVKKTGAVFLTAVLQYIAAEFLQLAGEEAKIQRKTRISPLLLKDTFSKQSEISKLLKHVTFGTMGE